MPQRATNQGPNGFKRGLAVSIANFFIGLLLIGGALLREDPLFWRNAGGYPPSLRALVLGLFYPLLTVHFCGIVIVSFLAIKILAQGFRAGGILFYAAMVQWILLAAIVTIAVWNNVDNLFHGMPLHYHPPI